MFILNYDELGVQYSEEFTSAIECLYALRLIILNKSINIVNVVQK